jgi:hypothetical protein
MTAAAAALGSTLSFILTLSPLEFLKVGITVSRPDAWTSDINVCEVAIPHHTLDTYFFLLSRRRLLDEALSNERLQALLLLLLLGCGEGGRRPGYSFGRNDVLK